MVRVASGNDLLGFLAHPDADDPEPGAGRAEAVWRAILRSEMMTVFVAAVDGVLAGSCMLVAVPGLTRCVWSYGPGCSRLG